jgi:ribonuclease E
LSRQMLINAQNPEEVRIATIEGPLLEDFQVEVSREGLTRGNIYKAIVTNVEPSLNAAFVDYGAERNGFLPAQDVVEQLSTALKDGSYGKRKEQEAKGPPKIQDLVKRGEEILVQITREPVDSKGGAVTMNLSLAGRYIILNPFDEVRGVSRKVEDEEIRKQLRQQASKLDVPEGAGFIVRTNALQQNKATLTRDFTTLLRLWEEIQGEARQGKGPKRLYNDQDIILRSLRDFLGADVREVIVDDERAYQKVRRYVRIFTPRGRVKVTRYNEKTPLFSRFDVESQIERIHERTVTLPSGGSIVFDRTEALIAIDVNSGKATRGGSQQETAFATNMEAAREVGRQLRLRDIGGLIVVDFIDMRSVHHQKTIEKELRETMKRDRARFTVGKISPNGLLEINRQRLQQALDIRTQRACPTCGGTGRIASREIVGLSLLRRIEAHVSTHPVERVKVNLHPELADTVQNDRRRDLVNLEDKFDLKIEIIASTSLHRSEQELEWFRRAEIKEDKRGGGPPVETPVSIELPDRRQSQSAEEVSSAAPPSASKKGRRRRRGRAASKSSSETTPSEPSSR